MTRSFAPVFALAALSGCAQMEVRDLGTEEGPLVARAMFSDEACSSDPKRATAESVFGPATTSWLIGKAAEGMVGYMTDALAEAARQDRDTVTISGQSPDYMYRIQGGKAKVRRCLYVVVAPRVGKGEWCLPNRESHWYNKSSCSPSDVPAEVREKWKEWSLGTPRLYAEIAMSIPEGGPSGIAIPKAYKVHYPKPVTGIDVEKLRGLTIAVSASKPTKSSKGSGETMFEVFLGGDGVTPTTVAGDSTVKTSGLWVKLPEPDGLLGDKYAGPVNLTVSVAESPHPTKWLQTIAKYVQENKQKAIDTIVRNVDPAARADTAQREVIDDLKIQLAAAKQCSEFSVQMGKLMLARNALNNRTSQDPEAALQSGYLLDATCAETKLAQRVTATAWSAAGGKVESRVHLCDRSKDPDEEILELCTQ